MYNSKIIEKIKMNIKKFKCRTHCCLLMIITIFIFIFISKSGHKHRYLMNSSNQVVDKCTISAFQKMILNHKEQDVIILTTTDYFYMDLTLNLYYSSLRLFNISNYIFGCTHYKACQELSRRNIQ